MAVISPLIRIKMEKDKVINEHTTKIMPTYQRLHLIRMWNTLYQENEDGIASRVNSFHPAFASLSSSS